MIFLLHHTIDEAAERFPERQAVGFLGRSLSYGELSLNSNKLAHTLFEQGVRRHSRVGIYTDKSLEMATAMYGIMKAGAAYVPLDPGAPAERLAFVLRDCGIRHLIIADQQLEKLRAVMAKGAALDCLIGVRSSAELPCRCVPWEEVHAAPGEAVCQVKTIEKDLAYIIYTSGSTGVPKGIMHTHHSGLSFARWAAQEYALRSDDRLGNHAPLHFDLSIFDFFAGAVAGAATVIIPQEYTRLPASYSRLIAEQRITVLFTVPFALIQLLLRGLLDERDCSALRWIIFGGEVFPTKYLRALMAKLPHCRFDNMYGPAEINGCTHYTVAELDNDDPIPIGEMCAIAQALVVDEADRPVEPGEVGELLARTPTMMQGYWGRQDLNARAFYRRETLSGYQEVFYRTGDLVRQRPDGIFDFLGRKDRQIKVRGYRVELDEVEAALVANESIEEAAVFSIASDEGTQRIQAEVMLKKDSTATAQQLLQNLKSRLPWYALPSRLNIRESFPRTSTGKIDRRELRARALAGESERLQN